MDANRLSESLPPVYGPNLPTRVKSITMVRYLTGRAVLSRRYKVRLFARPGDAERFMRRVLDRGGVVYAFVSDLVEWHPVEVES